MPNIFQGTKDHPHHLSVGAVVLNDKNEVCCHYFGKKVPGWKYGNLENFYLLMRETIEPNESLEQATARGLQEEFGIIAQLETYLGSLESHWHTLKDNIKIEKTTLYFSFKLISQDILKRKEDDAERMSEIRWVNIDELIEKIKEQGKRFPDNTIDESEILERVQNLVSK